MTPSVPRRRPPSAATRLGVVLVALATILSGATIASDPSAPGAATSSPATPAAQATSAAPVTPVAPSPRATAAARTDLMALARETSTPRAASAPKRVASPPAHLTAMSRPSLEPPPGPGAFAMNLYSDGDFTAEARADWCVPAAILTMMNVMDDAVSGARPSQRQLDRIARKLSTPRLVGLGSEPEGWAGTLGRLGYGPYVVRAESTRWAAIEAAARAIRLTGRPVGLLVWRGAHAWVMTGFEATADPAYTDDFRVTRVRIVDPWFPRVSSIWGPARPPDTRVSAAGLADSYLPWVRPGVRYPEKDGRYVLVVPDAGSDGSG
jgi:hypothetical protein